jgi:chemotaxis protein CheX
MDVSFVNPFITSTIHAFKTMLDCDVRPGTPSVKTEDKFTYDVSGIIGLTGKAQGAIALSFPKIMALKIVSILIGTEIKIVDREVADGIGEIANIIAGSAKQDLSHLALSISLPRVVVGAQHRILSLKSIPTILVPFTSNLGDFAMEVALKTDTTLP